MSLLFLFKKQGSADTSNRLVPSSSADEREPSVNRSFPYFNFKGGIFMQKQNLKTMQIGNRIASARRMKGLKQEELAALVAKELGRTNYAITTVSSWERGAKMAKGETLVAIASVCDVSVSYLLGEEAVSSTHDTTDRTDTASMGKVSVSELRAYDGLPLYLLMEDAEPAWAICDCKNQVFVGKDGVYSFDLFRSPTLGDSGIYFQFIPDDSLEVQNLRRVPVNRLSDFEKVYVRFIGRYTFQNRCYNGWYVVDLEHELLRNKDGVTFTFDKAGVTFQLYADYKYNNHR